jgi:hypothetical protein
MLSPSSEVGTNPRGTDTLMAHRSFVPSEPGEQKELPTFDIGGFRRSNGEAWKETFTCLPEAPPGVLDDLMTASIIDDRGNRQYNAPSLLAFFEGVLVEEDVRRFREWSHDKDRTVAIETLGEVMMWLAEEVAGRPTKR